MWGGPVAQSSPLQKWVPWISDEDYLREAREFPRGSEGKNWALPISQLREKPKAATSGLSCHLADWPAADGDPQAAPLRGTRVFLCKEQNIHLGWLSRDAGKSWGLSSFGLCPLSTQERPGKFQSLVEGGRRAPSWWVSIASWEGA